MASNDTYYADLTPLSFLERSAYVFRDKTAVKYGDQQWTYPEFQGRANQLASALRNWGLNKDDRVAFLSPNIPPLLEAHFGVPLAGGVLVALNTRLDANALKAILNHSEARAIFVDSELSNAIKPVLEELEFVELIVNIVDEQAGAPGKRLDGTDYESFIATGSADPLERWLESENDMISINYTSGTTGNPKGVMYTHRGAYLNALGEGLELHMNSDTRYLWTLPMFHCNDWCFTWGVVAVGGTHICLRQIDPPQVISMLTDDDISHFCGAPTVLIMLANDPTIENLKLDRPIRVATAGAPPSPTIIQTMESLGIDITHVYGLTETYGPHSVCEWQKPWNSLAGEERALIKARQGVPYIHAVEMRVVDSDMNDVPADGDSMGEVIMRGNNVMKGYFKNPSSTDEAFSGGWFHSGDIAVIHPDGYIELRDRAKDIIISGGENISTIEVEQAIARHPAVLEVAVVAIPHEKWGEVPKAFVTLRPGASASADEIIKFSREHLANFKAPKAVDFGELPKTSTGKVQKFVLREPEWVGYEKRIN